MARRNELRAEKSMALAPCQDHPAANALVPRPLRRRKFVASPRTQGIIGLDPAIMIQPVGPEQVLKSFVYLLPSFSSASDVRSGNRGGRRGLAPRAYGRSRSGPTANTSRIDTHGRKATSFGIQAVYVQTLPPLIRCSTSRVLVWPFSTGTGPGLSFD